jgi:peptide/nickel transport system ATP-binding protein
MSLLEVRHLTKRFAHSDGWMRRRSATTAVDDVTFSIETGETFGLVGESGSGKTTTGRCILRLVEPTAGEIRFKGEDVLAFDRSRLRAARRDMQIVFQDPFGSLNPRMTVETILEEPLRIHGVGTKSERAERVAELLTLVGLAPDMSCRRPAEFSGGQRQRIGLARALALSPSFVIADEPVSALDMSVQAQIVDLLRSLQQQLGLTYLFIAHDLRLVEHICDRVAVMYRGRVVEMGTTAALFASPRHSYTQALLSAVLPLEPGAPIARVAFDDRAIAVDTPLREIAAGHWAAI